MNAILCLDNWEITNAFGQYLKIEENEISDLCLRGEKRVASYLWHAVRPTRILDACCHRGNIYVLTAEDRFLLGSPSATYARVFAMTTKRFGEVITKKLKLI